MRISDWSSDVCSSDLDTGVGAAIACGSQKWNGNCALLVRAPRKIRHSAGRDRKSVVSGKSVSVRVDLGGRRIIKKKQTMIPLRQICRLVYQSCGQTINMSKYTVSRQHL